MTETDRSATKSVDPWVTLGFRLSVIISLIAVVGAVAKVVLYQQDQEEKAQKRAEAARLYLDGTPSTKTCGEAATSKQAVGCFLLLKPANTDIRLLRTIVDYPAAASPCGCSGTVQIGVPASITLDQIKPYLVRRTYTFTKAAASKTPLQVNVPVVITTQYDYKGSSNIDISAYALGYRILRDNYTTSVIPTGIVYCGRLSHIPTFVIDPWIPTEVGRTTQDTSSVLIECLQKATWFQTPHGRFRVTTDIASVAMKRGGFDTSSVPAFVKHYKVDALEGTRPQVTTTTIIG